MNNNDERIELKRLHVASIFVSFLQTLRAAIVPLIFGLFLGSSREPIGFFRFEYIWIGIFIFIIISGIAKWISFKYRIRDGELYVQQGIFIKKKRYIQEQRVQSIDITAGLFQRMFGLVQLNIETAGGGLEPDIRLIAITRDEAESIRAELLKKRIGNEMKADDPLEADEFVLPKKEITWKLSKRRLLITALTSSGLALAISAVVALFSQIEQFIPSYVYEWIFSFVTKSSVIFVVIIICFLILVAWFISMIGTVLKYGNFTIEKIEDELIITRGLLEQRQLTIQTNRVTAVRIVKNLFRQPFGYVAVYVESAGGGSTDEQLSTILFPLVKENELTSLFAIILPEYSFARPITRIPKRALRRRIIRFSTMPLLLTIIGGIYVSPHIFYGFIIVIFLIILAFVSYRDAGTGFNEKYIWLRSRFISIVTVVSARKKIQAVEMTTSPFQHRQHLTSFHFSVQSSAAGKTFTIRDIGRKQGDKLLHWF